MLPILAINLGAVSLVPAPAYAQSATEKKPNILLIVSDDTGWGDLGPYLGGAARGMPTPSFEKLADEGMFFTNFYGQRAARLSAQRSRPGASRTGPA